MHDILLFYARGRRTTWNQQFEPYTDEYIATHFVHVDPDGRRFRRVDMRNPGVRPNLHYDYTASNGITYKPHDNGWVVDRDKMEELDRDGRLFFPQKRDGRLRRKLYLDESAGVPVSDNWIDIKPIFATAAERLGYPTQKPEALLDRIISASSNEGDVVLDPFCGCGTATVAAQTLGRRWIGIDITHLAITLIKTRLKDSFGLVAGKDYEVQGEPVSVPDAQTLAATDPWQFQWWALGLVGARPTEQKKGADKGIDGRLYFHDEAGAQTKQVMLSVKAGHTSAPHVRDLRGVVEREGAAIGVLITMQESTSHMRTEAAAAGFYDSPWGGSYPRIQILTVAQLLAGERIDYPNVEGMDRTFKKAPKAQRKGADHPELPLGE